MENRSEKVEKNKCYRVAFVRAKRTACAKRSKLAGIKLIDENGGGAAVAFRKPGRKAKTKSSNHRSPISRSYGLLRGISKRSQTELK